MLILRSKIALNAVICMILVIFSLIMESWILRNVGLYRSLLQFYYYYYYYYYYYCFHRYLLRTKLKKLNLESVIGVGVLHSQL